MTKVFQFMGMYKHLYLNYIQNSFTLNVSHIAIDYLWSGVTLETASKLYIIILL